MLKQLIVSAEQKRVTKEASRKVEEKVANERRLWAAKLRTPTKKRTAP
jgi:hypothetical protein